jgi:Domain of unknown function (DUF4148)
MDRTSFILAALLALAASIATAQTASPSRAEVKAETQRARKAGEIVSGEQSGKEAPFVAGQTRAERKAATREAIAKGEMSTRGEASPPEAQPKVAKGSGKARAEVKAEARAANKAGGTRTGESYPEKSR